MFRIIVDGTWLATGFKHFYDAVAYAETHFYNFTILEYIESTGKYEIAYEA